MTVTVAEVVKWGKLPSLDADEVALMERVIAGTIECMERQFIVTDPLSDAQEQAALMQCVRTWKRRDTPEGLVGVNDFGPIRIANFDNDIERLLVRRYGIA